MQHAMSVEVIGNGETKEERYYECGAETVQQSQMLLALWDGKPSQGLGGTEEIFTYAKNQGRPVVWIHSVTGEVQHFNQEKESFSDPELDFLNGLPDSGAKPEIKTPFDLAQAWFWKIDDNASHAAPQLRRLAAIPILVHGRRGDLYRCIFILGQQRSVGGNRRRIGIDDQRAAECDEIAQPANYLDENPHRSGNLQVRVGAVENAGALRCDWAGNYSRAWRECWVR